MPIPDYQSLMLPVLKIVVDRKEHPVSDIRKQIASELHLSDEELSERLASDTTTVFMNRIGWAVQYLKEATTIRAVRRGVYQITDRGFTILSGNPPEITVKMLRKYPEFAEFVGKGSDSEPTIFAVAPLSESKATPEESLENSYKVLRDALANDVLESIKNGTPAAFEQVVVDLLVAMGYGGSWTVLGKWSANPAMAVLTES